MSEDSEDELGELKRQDAPRPSGGVDAYDDAEVHGGFRAQFPTTFGRQEKQVLPLESVHAKTRRTEGAKASVSATPVLVGRQHSGNRDIEANAEGFVGPRPLPPAEDDEDVFGPPRALAQQEASTSSADSEDEDESEAHRIPTSNEIMLKGHMKACHLCFAEF